MLAQLEHAGHDDAFETAAEVALLLDSHAEHGEVMTDALGWCVDRREVTEPREEDLHVRTA
jgi:hypothetical protein